jgi:hypothetical protein
MHSEAVRQTGHHRVIETISVVILAIATVASAWCGYQANRWNGEQAEAYERSSQFQIEAATAEARATDALAVDIALYISYLNAQADNQPELAERYLARVQPAFADAWEAWRALPPDATTTRPSSMPEFKDSPDAIAAVAARQEAETYFRAGLTASEHSDQFTLAAVALAGVLFIAGIVSSILWTPARIAMIVLAVGGLVSALAWLARIPQA